MLVLLLAGPGWFKAILVLVWAKLTGTPYNELGYVRPKSWMLTLLTGVILGGAFKLIMKAVVMPLFGADPINHTYHFLVGNIAALPAMLFTMIVTAGFGEETVFRGYLFERLKKLFGRGRNATIAIVLISSAIFAILHYPDQGIAGVEQAFCTGIFFATLFLFAGHLWLPMVAHAAFDLTAVAIIYCNIESEVAHCLFK